MYILYVPSLKREYIPKLYKLINIPSNYTTFIHIQILTYNKKQYTETKDYSLISDLLNAEKTCIALTLTNFLPGNSQ
jgi:hypothetical protein